ncbi:ATP-binding protein [Desulfobacterales bacterium HSG17]|nr:ATP-binding protein [Desulfobacterales bacterium HSG17]
MYKSIRRDLSAGIGVAVLCVCLTTGAIYYFFTMKMVERDFNEYITHQTKSIADMFTIQLWLFDLNNIRKLGKLLLNSPQITGIILKDFSQIIILNEGLTDEKAGVKVDQNLFHKNSRQVGKVEIYFSNTPWQQHKTNILYMGGIIVTGAIATLCLLINILINKYLSYPLEKLRVDIASFSAGQFEVSGLSNQRIEIQTIIDSFNELARKIELRDKEISNKTISLEKEIQARKKTEKFLKESEKKYQGLYENAPDIFVTVETGTAKIINCNRTMVDQLGYSKSEIIGRPVFDMLTPGSVKLAKKKIFPLIMKSAAITGEELQVLKKDGSTIDVSLNVSTVSDENENIIEKRFIWRNITEIKKLESQLQHNQRLESIGTLAGGVAHEINNPINGIMNYAQLIKDRLDPENQLSEFAGEIILETDRVAEIVMNLLTFASHDKQEHSKARIHDIVEATLSLIRTLVRHDHITLEVDVPDDLPEVECRSEQIRQVLMNLLTNARDALNERYKQYHEDKIIRVFSRYLNIDGKRWIRTTVEDHGHGLNPEIQERIFDPFITTKPREHGTGLGLSISYGIVHEHHGKLHVESEADRFTRFHLDLPVNNGWELEKKDI